MASASSVLSEDQFQCSICLDVFTKPVTTPCGHTFCKTCITVYWDNNNLTQCPLCKNTFDKRPDISVNVVMSELAAELRKSFKKEPISSLDQHPAQPGEVPCDICIGRKVKALKSCLGCLTSYCETHLEPHQRVAALTKHKLIDPVENLEDRVCKKHDRPLELFCRTDQTCVCYLCLEKTHENHDTVPLEREYRERKDQIRKERAGFQQMIQERALKVQEIKHSEKMSKSEAECEKADSVEVFTVLLASIKRSQAEVIELIEEKQRAAGKQAEGFIKELEQEVTELKRSTELEKLLDTEDHLHLLQGLPSLSSPPPTKDWSQISFHSDVSVGTVRRAVVELKKTLSKEMEKLPAVKLKRIQQYEVDVTLDPDTAHPELFLSEDGKQVYHGDIWKNLPDYPERFDHVVRVLGKQGFSSGRFYFEVQVKGKTKWDIGVARESVDRKKEILANTANGFWDLCLRDGEIYRALTNPPALLSLTAEPQKVGVFVDYEKGEVSFYDVETRAHIYSFTGCTFSDKLYPYFNPGLNDRGTNSAPLIICPLKNKD